MNNRLTKLCSFAFLPHKMLTVLLTITFIVAFKTSRPITPFGVHILPVVEN